jgi:ribosome biogenesis GTPase / thiamine phosphate phosphatase
VAASPPRDHRPDLVAAPSLTALGADADLCRDIDERLVDLPPGATAGRVSRVDRGRFQLLTAVGPIAVATKGVAPVCVGDWCLVRPLPSSDRQGVAAELLEVLPRRASLIRQASGSRSEPQALAANIDIVLVLVPLDRDLSPRQIERFLALAWDSGAQPVLVLTKRDLVDSETAAAALAASEAIGSDLTVVTASVVSGVGVDRIAAMVTRGTTVALLGTSGAGKSSLVNALMGSDAVKTGEVRQADAKGRHTTTWRELVVVPTGGTLIDTPGLRELGMWVDEEGIDAVFTDITDLESGCRFNDCAHGNEPGCAVLAAIAAGTLPAERLASYRTLLGESADAAAENDRRLTNEERKNSRQRSGGGRR